MCELCLNDNQYFDLAGCQDCPEIGDRLGAPIGIGISVILTMFVLFALHEHRGRRWARCTVSLRRWVHLSKRIIHSVGVVSKIKMALTFAQVVATFDSTYAVGLPDVWFRWTEMLRFIGELDWAKCAARIRTHHRV